MDNFFVVSCVISFAIRTREEVDDVHHAIFMQMSGLQDIA
jgi:hypothetical protein